MAEKIDERSDFLKQLSRARFAQAECPKLHTERLGGVEGPKEWHGLLESLAGKVRKGFLVALTGERGTGKTQLAVNLIHLAAQIPCRCRYIVAAELFRDIRRTFSSRDENERDVVEKFCEPRLLVIDELHQRAGTEWEHDTLVNIIDARYREMKATLMITNHMESQAFSNMVGDSIASRLLEAGGVITCSWPKFRKQGMWDGE